MTNLNTFQKQIARSTNDALKQLEHIRQQIIECDDEITWLDESPLPLTDALTNVDKFISEQASAPGIKQFFFDRKIHQQPLRVEAKERMEWIDLSGVLCGLFPDQIRAALMKQVQCLALDIEPGAPRAERPKLIAEAKARRIALEHEEEQIIDAAERSGLSGFYRRQDVNPFVVLMKEAA